MNMKKETNEKFELNDVIIIIAFVCGILTMIFGYHPREEIIDNIFFYGLGTFVFTIGYIILFHLLAVIIGLPIAFIIGLFIKNNKESD